MARKSRPNTPLEKIHQEVIACEACPRLRSYCMEVARTKRRQFMNEEYWGRPVPGFGDGRAEIMIVGLAPAAHGANRTGRMFTGDNSGVWLYRALFKAGLSNQEKSTAADDDLQLHNVYIGATARCAPPDNKPLPEEIKNCEVFLKAEMRELKNLRVYIVLGQIALRALWRILPDEVKSKPAFPQFGHGVEIPLKDGKTIVCSFHPSQQNTFTKKLTEPMFDSIFERAKRILEP